MTVCFILVAYYYGGEKFRWFGVELEKTAADARIFMNKTADTADDLGQRMHAVMGTYKKTKETVRTINKAAASARAQNKPAKKTKSDNTTTPKDDKDTEDDNHN
jgi:hypothetical protein